MPLPVIPAVLLGEGARRVAFFVGGYMAQKAWNYLFTPVQGGPNQDSECMAMKKFARYDAKGNFIECYDPTTTSDTLPAPVIPRLSDPPRKIYEDQPRHVLPSPKPELPLRRLPTIPDDLPVGGGTSKSFPSKTIVIKETIEGRIYGSLLHEPVSNSPVRINISSSADYKENFLEQQSIAAVKFLFFLLIKSGQPIPEASANQIEETYYTPEAPELSTNPQDYLPITLRESGLILITKKTRQRPSTGSGSSGSSSSTNNTTQQEDSVFQIFGCDGIAEYINDMTKKSNFDLMGIGSLIPLNYEIIDTPFYVASDKHASDIVEPSTSASGVDITTMTERIYEILGGDIWGALRDPSNTDAQVDGETFLKNLIYLIYPPNKSKIDHPTDPEAEDDMRLYSFEQPETTQLLTQDITNSGNNLLPQSAKPKPIKIKNLIDLIGVLTTNQFYRMGGYEYPATLPATLIDETPLVDTAAEKKYNVTKIPNLAKFIEWFVVRVDELVGEFEIPIEIKDVDPSTPGDQPVKLSLPNIAESIAEMFLLLFQTSIDTQTVLNIATRTMLETGQDKQQNYITYRLVQALVDWAGFKVKEDKEKLPLLFTPNKDDYDQMLQETEIDVLASDYDEKHSLEADLMRFRRAAAILESTHFKKINPFKDTKNQIMDSIREKAKMLKDMLDKDDDEFEKFIEAVQEGFGKQPGIDSPNEPYGRPYAQRPKIRDLSKPEDSSTE